MEIKPQSNHLSSPSRNHRHHRSPSPEAESESKRRKRHHHRHHRHHRHRHHSKRDRKEGGDDKVEDGVDKIKVDEDQMAEDGEIEEGEILEEGEIVSDRENKNLEFTKVDQIDSKKETEALDDCLDSITCEPLPKNCDSPRKEIEAVPEFGDADKTKEKTHSERKKSVNDDDENRDTAVKYKDRKDNDITSDHSRGRHKNSDVSLRDQSRSYDIDYDCRNHSSKAEMEKDKHRKHVDREDMNGDYDRQKEKDRGVNRERERSASHSRHDRRDRHDRHDRRDSKYSDRDRERDREKEMPKELHRERETERERSSSISSRHDQDRNKRERDRDVSRNRVTEKPRDVSRDRYREREVDKERERENYGYDRDRGWSRDRYRENDRQIGRDRANNRDRKNDSRRSKYDERDRHGDRIRLKETFSAGHDSLERKGEPLREEDGDDYQERIEQQLANQEEEDLEKIKEESRKRRQAILEKYKQQQFQHKPVESPEDEDSTHKDTKKDSSEVKQDSSDLKQDSPDGYAIDPSFSVEKSPIHNGASTLDKEYGAGGLGEGSPKSERSADMFCDDIFGESPVGIRKSGRGDALQIEQSGLHDNWDDAEGYYSYRFGEVLDGRYEVIAAHGKGVFSTVVRAKDLKAAKGEPEEVAIKIIRNNETMYKAGQEELKILGKLVAADPEDRRHCVRFLSTFKYRNHLCLVFESLHMNLREVLKKFGRNIGLKLTAVRTYAKQLFIALKHLRNCGVLHCDIKPDNMLVNEGKNVLKLCDFGNAMSTGKNEPTPYLVSRFYRAPEIILGLDYDHPMDMWSVGCCLYELYCGKVLFPGPSNNDMLRLHMELKGSFPKKMLRKGLFINQHFDQDLNFLATEEDPVTRKAIKRLLLNIKPKDISTLISSSPGEDPKMTAHFKDLLERIFVLDPEKRLTVSQALSHPFITGK